MAQASDIDGGDDAYQGEGGMKVQNQNYYALVAVQTSWSTCWLGY